MADLNAMIISANVYNSALDNLMRKTDQVVKKLLTASTITSIATNKMINAGVAIDKAAVKMLKASTASDKVAKKMLDVGTNTSDVATKLIKASTITGKASVNLLKASKNASSFNTQLSGTKKNSEKATISLNNLLGSLGKLKNVQKGIQIFDDYTSLNTKLTSVNDGNQQPEELQDKVFTAAGRSRGSFSDMAEYITNLENSTGNLFGSNDETIAFTELVQRSFVAGGSGTEESKSSINQLINNMAEGGMKGEDLTSISQSAPLILEAISKYTGKSGEELQALADQGAITADTIKNSMFAMSGDINSSFADAPMTFSDMFTKVKDGGLQAFTGIMDKIQELISNPQFQQFVNALVVGFGMLGDVVGAVIDGIINGWDMIGPILGVIGVAYLTSIIIALWKMIPPLITQVIAWLTAAAPILLVVGLIFLVMFALNQLGVSWETMFGFIGGIIGVFVGAVYNKFVYMWNFIASFINFFGNVFNDPITSIKILFNDLAINILGALENMVKGIGSLLNLIPGVEIDISSGLTDLKNKFEEDNKNLKANSNYKEFVPKKEYVEYDDAFGLGFDIGGDFAIDLGEGIQSIKDTINGKGLDTTEPPFDISGYTGANTPIPVEGGGSPIPVEGTGSGGAVEVEMPGEDLDYLREIAERDYIANIATNSLAPNISVQFGDVHESADANQVAGRIKQILQEEIAMVSEGVY